MNKKDVPFGTLSPTFDPKILPSAGDIKPAQTPSLAFTCSVSEGTGLDVRRFEGLKVEGLKV